MLAERQLASRRERRTRLFERGFITILNGPDHVFELANAVYRGLFGDREYVASSQLTSLHRKPDRWQHPIMCRLPTKIACAHGGVHRWKADAGSASS